MRPASGEQGQPYPRVHCRELLYSYSFIFSVLTLFYLFFLFRLSFLSNFSFSFYIFRFLFFGDGKASMHEPE